jgi:hypothetical protein
VTLSRFIINDVVAPVSVYDSQVAEELLENTAFPLVLAELSYLSQDLKQGVLFLDTNQKKYASR